MTMPFWVVLLLVSALQSSVQDGVTVKGRIISPGSPAISENGRVTMTVSGIPRPPLQSAVGADGSFEFQKVVPGTYRLTSTPGVLAQPATIVVSDKNISDIELLNPKPVEVTGNVVVQDGGLQPSFTVGFAPHQGGLRAGLAIPANGAFTVSLSEGDYRINWSALPVGYFVRSVQSGSVDLLSKPLTIVGAPVPPITITLGVSAPPPWVKVSGRVTGLPATSNGAARVILSGEGVPIQSLPAPIQPGGAFTFPMVLSGTYTLGVSAIPGGTPPNTTIYVGRKDVDDIQIVIPVKKCVPGRVVVEGGGPLPNLNFSLLAPSGIASSLSTASVVPRADGNFGILLPEEERRITLGTTFFPSGYTLKSFTYGSTNLLVDTLRLSSADTASLLLTIAAAPGSWADVRGRVTGIDPTARPYRVQMDQGVLSSPVQPDGSFGFGKVLRGNHTVSLFSIGGIPVSKSLVMAGQDITAFELAAPPQKEVVGRVTREGGGQGFVRFDFLLRGSAGSVTVSASAGPDGNFKIALPVGENQISASGVPAGAIKSLQYGDVDLMKEPLRVARTDTAELRVTVAAGTTSGVLGGILTDVNGGTSACNVSSSAR